MKRARRWISICLITVLLFGQLPTDALAAEGMASGYGGNELQREKTAVQEAAVSELSVQETAGEACTLTFQPEGGTVSTAGKTVYVGETYGTLPTPQRTGYVFTGWFTSTSGSIQVMGNQLVEVLTSDTLYAHWKPNTYQVYFDSMEGGEAPAREVLFGTDYGELPEPVREGWKFLG